MAFGYKYVRSLGYSSDLTDNSVQASKKSATLPAIVLRNLSAGSATEEITAAFAQFSPKACRLLTSEALHISYSSQDAALSAAAQLERTPCDNRGSRHFRVSDRSC